MALYEAEQSKPMADRYIHEISSCDGINIIVTLIPALAERLHFAKATQHDNTYKRAHGEWKEWEATIWDEQLDKRTNWSFE